MQPNNKVSLLAELNILPGYEKAVKEAAGVIWKATLQESGCEQFIYNIKKENPETIVFFEVFDSEQGFEAHKTARHTRAFLDFVKGKVVGDGPMLTFLQQYED